MPTSAPWIATPNKTDHLTQGFTSKILYNYQYTGGVGVENGNEVFEVIKNSFGKNFKGTNGLPANYFAGDDGRTLKISMYFFKTYDGTDINLRQQLYDTVNYITYHYDFDYSYTVATDTGSTLVKYEVYLTYFYETTNPAYATSAIGSMFFHNKPDGNNMVMLQLNTSNDLSNGTSPAYEVKIYNNGGTIYPVSLMIEEIS